MNVHLVEKIGSGAFGTVYRGHSLRNGATVAVKTISKLKSTHVQQDRFKREVSACKSLRHRHIIKVHEVHETEEEIKIVMDYAEGTERSTSAHPVYLHTSGGDFLNLVNSGDLLEKDARNYMMQLISTLQYANSQGWVHLDVK